MPRGGQRPGAGGRPTWKHGKTKTIRVPDVLADKILEMARVLDAGEEPKVFEALPVESTETQSKVLDLTGIMIHAHKRGPAVYLADLLRAGYEIKPSGLVQRLKGEAQANLDRRKDLESFIGEFYG
jgi:hypothetical protein